MSWVVAVSHTDGMCDSASAAGGGGGGPGNYNDDGGDMVRPVCTREMPCASRVFDLSMYTAIDTLKHYSRGLQSVCVSRGATFISCPMHLLLPADGQVR
jgi:hypothetical protein